MKFTKSSSFYSIQVWEFNLPACHTCPFARDCKTSVDRETGKQFFDDNRVFRCYAASGERFPVVRQNRWGNFDELKGQTVEEMVLTNCCRNPRWHNSRPHSRCG